MAESADAAATAVSDDPTLIFDGTTCTYEEPPREVVGGLTPVVLENTSNTDSDAGLFWIRNQNALDAAFDALHPGTGSDILLASPLGSIWSAWLQAGSGDSDVESLVLDPGLYLLDCAHIPYGGSQPDYVWREEASKASRSERTPLEPGSKPGSNRSGIEAASYFSRIWITSSP